MYSVSKLLERLVLHRINDHLNSTGFRAENQFGFRYIRSTEDATEAILHVVRGATLGATQQSDLCILVSLDVKNAFNTVPWDRIDEALYKRRMPQPLVNLIRIYLRDRSLIETTTTQSGPTWSSSGLSHRLRVLEHVL